MATDDSELMTLEEAYDSIAADVDVEELVDAPQEAAPAAVEETDVEAEAAVEAEQADEGAEEEGPRKLSDLVDEEPAPEGEAQPKLPEVVDVPKHGQVPLQELVDGYLRNADYTQKTQELAEQRRAAEQAVQLWDMLEQDPTGTIAQMAVRAGLLSEDALQNVPASAPPPVGVPSAPQTEQPDIEALVAQKVQEVLESTPEIGRIRKEAATQRVQGELDRLEKTYGASLDNDDRVALVKTAISNQEGLELTFLKMQQRLEKLNAEKGRVERSVTAQKSSRVPSKDVSGERPKTIEEAWERAVSSLS